MTLDLTERREGASRLLTRQERWRARNPQAASAHRAVQLAVRTGRLVPGPCEVCGRPDTEGHHDDYAAPLVVRWLCRPHHRALHRARKFRAKDGGE